VGSILQDEALFEMKIPGFILILNLKSMGMTKFLGFIFLCYSFSALAQKGVHESVQLDKPPVIDGLVDDWPVEWWIDPDGKFLCNVFNDEENLYFRLKIADDLTQQKIGLFGLSLKLNPKGKRKGKLGLKYPVGKDKSELKKEKPSAVNPNTDLAAKLAMKKAWVSDVEVVELIGLAKENIVSSRLGLANGIEAIIIAQDDGSYIYEAKIPFKAFRINKKEVPLLGVEFETGRMTVQNNNPANNNPSYSPTSRGPGGCGQQSQQRYYSNYQYNVLTTPGYLWVGVKLK
jgi:hypothetical protein